MIPKNSAPEPVDASNINSIPVIPKERYDLRILRSLRRILRSVEVYSRKLAQEHGVTVPQLICLLKIDELGALTIKELSEEVFLAPSTLVGIIDRLEKQDLIERRRSARDRRKVRISLTEGGIALLQRSPSPLQDSLTRAIDNLPELERATIALSLEKVTDLMEAHPQIDEAQDTAPVLDNLIDSNEK